MKIIDTGISPEPGLRIAQCVKRGTVQKKVECLFFFGKAGAFCASEGRKLLQRKSELRFMCTTTWLQREWKASHCVARRLDPEIPKTGRRFKNRWWLPVATAAIFAYHTKLEAQTNLVQPYNPNFEGPSFTMWAPGPATLDTATPGEGAQSARMPYSSGSSRLHMNGYVPVNPGKSYLMSVLTKQTLVGGNASFGLRMVTSTSASAGYLWKPTTGSASWHWETSIFKPLSTASFVQVYFGVFNSPSSGDVEWDAVRLSEVEDTGMTSLTLDANAVPPVEPLLTGASLVLQFAGLPVTVFTKSGSTISPSVLTPAVKFGNMLVGGTFSWKIVNQAGAASLAGSAPIRTAGPWLWTIDLNLAASFLPAGRYYVHIDATNVDSTIIRTQRKAFLIQ